MEFQVQWPRKQVIIAYEKDMFDHFGSNAISLSYSFPKAFLLSLPNTLSDHHQNTQNHEKSCLGSKLGPWNHGSRSSNQGLGPAMCGGGMTVWWTVSN